ncbi:hypothetical protein B0T17DRAFT_543723 [Bombardia bombarda]|uniref:Uncharacterized protein n=1 Tax=Bombardia bombarda TaxID=252184 RepID=A0AA39TIA6_9PEZI|nr:hypothetical protein B0T17DRAFT_543723 [Bombardia bombarda]
MSEVVRVLWLRCSLLRLAIHGRPLVFSWSKRRYAVQSAIMWIMTAGGTTTSTARCLDKPKRQEKGCMGYRQVHREKDPWLGQEEEQNIRWMTDAVEGAAA